MDDDGGRWLVLLHHLPPTPAYLRAKVLRRLGQIGAVSIKRSAYVLPANPRCLEDVQWLAREIREEGGEAWCLRASFVTGLRDEELEEMFNAARDRDYGQLAEGIRKVLVAASGYPKSAALPAVLRADWTRLRKRLVAARRIDFFGAPRAREVEDLVTRVEETLLEPGQGTSSDMSIDRRFEGRVWVTRMGIEEDRMASAWLIRRFIDPAARFRFVDPDSYTAGREDIPFDMYEGEFTHQEGHCTFQVLRERFRLKQPALRTIGEIVHEIDLKDDRYGRPETPGVSVAIEGIVVRHVDDEARLRDALVLFDSLFARLTAESH